MSYFITQQKGGLGENPIIISRKISEEELKQLGFFPLSEAEQRYFDRVGLITIPGDNKTTTIKRR